MIVERVINVPRLPADDARCATRALAAVTGVRCNPVRQRFSQQLLARHKPRNVALIAWVRKLLTCLTAMLRNGTPWDPALPAP